MPRRADRPPYRRPLPFAFLFALAIALLPGKAEAVVFKSQQELDDYWKIEYELPLSIYRSTFNDLTQISRDDMGNFDADNPATGRGLQLLYDKAGARMYKGLQQHGYNGVTAMLPEIPLSRAYVKPIISKWYNQCNRYNDVVKLVTDKLAPLQKKRIDYAYAKDPAHDFDEKEIAGVLASDVNWFTQSNNNVYIGTPISLMGSMIGDSYWTDDREGFGHPCVYAWMMAAIASRPNSDPDPKNTFDYWNLGRDNYLDFESVYIPANLCQAKGMDFCYPRAFYTIDWPLPEDGAMETNIGLVLNRLNELIKQYSDLTKGQQEELDALKKANEEKARQDALLRERVLGSGSALSLPLPLSSVTIPTVISRVLNALLGTVGALALLLFVWSGIRWMLARGNADEIAKAKKSMTWTALGLFAIFASYAILSTIIKALTGND